MPQSNGKALFLTGEAYRSGTKSEHYWAHWTSAYNGKPPSTYLLSCTHIHALRRSTFSSIPSFYWSHPSFYWNFWYPPYWIYKSYWVQSGLPKEENLRRRGLYCQWVLSEILMEKQGPP